MNIEFEYIHGANLTLTVTANVTPPTSINFSCAMEDAVEPNGWEVEILTVTLPDGLEFETDKISEGEYTLDELLEEKAVEEYGE